MNFLLSENKNICTQILKGIIVSICLLISTQNLRAQFYKIEKFNELDGLISSGVNTICQDNRGYLWIGTEKGLSKYDGYDFKNYNTVDGLNNDFVKHIYQDSDNFIWVASNEGLNKINPSKIRNGGIQNVVKEVIVTSVIEYEDNIFFSSNLGLHKIISSDSILMVSLPRVRSLKEVDGKLIAAAASGLYQYQNKSGQLDKIWTVDDPSSNFVRTVLKGFESDLLLGTMNGLIIWNQLKNEDYLMTNLDRISHLSRDSKDRVWIASETGITRLNEKGSLTHFPDKELNKSSSYILEDKEGNIWIAGIDGLLKYSEYPFERVDFTNKKSANGISSILQTNKEEIWYGGSEGDIWIKDTSGKARQFELINQYSDSKPINGIFEDANKNIWISTLLKGVFIWDGDNIRPFNDPKGLLRFFNFDIEEESNGALWFGGARGLLRYENDIFQYYTFLNADRTPFVNDIHIDQKGRIWLALNSGIGIIRNGKILRLSAFNDKTCTQVSSDDQGNIVVAMANYGLTEFHYEKDLLKIKNEYSIENGLSNNNVNSLHIDINNTIWAGTDFGINKISKGNDIQVFRMSQNLLKSKCYLNSIVETKEEMVFGTYDGVIEIPKAKMRDRSRSIRSYITGISILNEDFDTAEVQFDSMYYNLPVNLVLPYNANFISFRFEGLSFASPEGLQYQYRLLGLESDFSEPGKERNFTYANLDDGQYTFQVRSRKPNDSWSEEKASFTFEIKPPFWEEWWFRILAVTIFFGSIFLIVNNRIQSIRKEEKEKSDLSKKIAEFRLTALRAQMNPHFIFNALYSIQHFITINEKEAAINYLAKFASLIRLILENSGKNEVLLSEEVKMLDLYLDLEKLRFDNKFQYKIEVDQAIHEEDTAIPYLLIQPFVENAVIHGVGYKKENGLINIKFLPTDDDDLLRCIVEDNGVGREAAEKLKKPNPIKSQSLGLKVNNERLEILNPEKIIDTSVRIIDLKDKEGEALGTRVEITIPIS